MKPPIWCHRKRTLAFRQQHDLAKRDHIAVGGDCQSPHRDHFHTFLTTPLVNDIVLTSVSFAYNVFCENPLPCAGSPAWHNGSSNCTSLVCTKSYLVLETTHNNTVWQSEIVFKTHTARVGEQAQLSTPPNVVATPRRWRSCRSSIACTTQMSSNAPHSQLLNSVERRRNHKRQSQRHRSIDLAVGNNSFSNNNLVCITIRQCTQNQYKTRHRLR